MGVLLNQSPLARRPLELHHHKPLAIKTSIPKFEDNFNPERHYDPDRERTELAKLKKEHKRERKGPIRELRKDSRILASSSLKERRSVMQRTRRNKRDFWLRFRVRRAMRKRSTSARRRGGRSLRSKRWQMSAHECMMHCCFE